MVELTINEKKYLIKTSWDDVPYSFYAELKNPYGTELKLIDRISKFTGIEPDVVSVFTLTQLSAIIELTSFMESDITAFKPVQIDTQIGKESWGKMEAAKQVFAKVENPYLAIAEVVKQYTNFDILDKPVSEVYAYVDFFLHSSISLQRDTND